MAAKSGTCRACGQEAVQGIEDGKIVRTYHPYTVSGPCPALLPIPNSGHLGWPLSANIPPEQFKESS